MCAQLETTVLLRKQLIPVALKEHTVHLPVYTRRANAKLVLQANTALRQELQLQLEPVQQVPTASGALRQAVQLASQRTITAPVPSITTVLLVLATAFPPCQVTSTPELVFQPK